MSRSEYPPPCFSNQCGFCEQCNSRAKYIKQSYNPQDSTKRAVTLSKFMKSSLNDISETYRNNIYKIKNREKESIFNNYKEYIYGIIPETKYINESILNDPSIYTRIKTPHNKVCDNPKCKAVYITTPEYFQKSFYPHVPMYKRETNIPNYLCCECVRQS